MVQESIGITVNPSPALSSLDVSILARTINLGESITGQIYLEDAEILVGIANKPVIFEWYRPDGSLFDRVTLYTDPYGLVRHTITPDVEGDWTLRGIFEGDAEYSPSSDETYFTVSAVPVRLLTTMGLAIMDLALTTIFYEVTAGQSVYLRARLIDENGNPVVGRQITAWVIEPDGVRRELGIATTDANGVALFSETPTKVGSHTYYAEFTGDDQYEGCTEEW